MGIAAGGWGRVPRFEVLGERPPRNRDFKENFLNTNHYFLDFPILSK